MFLVVLGVLKPVRSTVSRQNKRESAGKGGGGGWGGLMAYRGSSRGGSCLCVYVCVHHVIFFIVVDFHDGKYACGRVLLSRAVEFTLPFVCSFFFFFALMFATVTIERGSTKALSLPFCLEKMGVGRGGGDWSRLIRPPTVMGGFAVGGRFLFLFVQV